MANTLTNVSLSPKQLALIREWARLRGWRLELPDLANRVFYFRANNHKTVRVPLDDILWELADFAITNVKRLEYDLR